VTSLVSGWLVVSVRAAAQYVLDAFTADTASAATAADAYDHHHDDNDRGQHHQQDVPPFRTETMHHVRKQKITSSK